MSEIKIVDGKETVVINEKPFWNWGRSEWSAFHQETKDLLVYCDKVTRLYVRYGHKMGYL